MQLCAISEKKEVIFADRASKRHNYYCLECKGVVRLRGGIHRQKHFYHLRPLPSCKQSSKSQEHIQTQMYIKNLIGGECFVELPFREIKRIADCAWKERKIVFEIQCSPILQEEVLARNRDYESQGFRVVWILHDKKFNQQRLSQAEIWLQDQPHYFTNINELGEGIIYDQYDMVENGLRKRLLGKSPIWPNKNVTSIADEIPPILRQRFDLWKMGFLGDWVERSSNQEDREFILEALKGLTAEIKTHKPLLFQLWLRFIAEPYRIFFAYMLEKACR